MSEYDLLRFDKISRIDSTISVKTEHKLNFLFELKQRVCYNDRSKSLMRFIKPSLFKHFLALTAQLWLLFF